MNVRHTDTDDTVVGWLAVGLRVVTVGALLPAGILKFLNYDSQANKFTELGVPQPELLLVVVGAVELLIAVALAVGVASRTAAALSVLVMLGAIWFVGVVPSNAIVLLASVGILALGPGYYAVWTPESELLGNVSISET